MLMKNVQKMIEEQDMIQPGDHVLAGVSGGADSVCLLRILCILREKIPFSVEVIHVEHGIRGEESRQDAAFVEQLAEQLQVAYQMKAVNVPAYATEKGLGLEEAARLLRYEIFEEAAKEKHAKIALAHHMEDNAETILFQLARGSSLTGLCGISPVRKSETGVTYIRPLLSLHRKEIEAYLKAQGQAYCTDSTNRELEYSRNYLRNIILPELNYINKKAVAHINATANHLSEIRSFMEEQTAVYWEQVAREDEGIVLDCLKLQGLHTALQKEIVYKAIGRMAGGKKDISLVHVEQVLGLLEKQSGKRVTLPNGVIGIKEYAGIRFLLADTKERGRKPSDTERKGRKLEDSKLKDGAEAAQVLEVTGEQLGRLLEEKETLCLSLGKKGEEMLISVFDKEMESVPEACFSECNRNRNKEILQHEKEIPRKSCTKWMDYDKIKDGFCIRRRRSGDYLIYDKSGHRKKLKQYFIDEKIPVTKRENTWIAAQDNVVLWVALGRMSEHIKVTEETKSIVEVTFTMKEEID